MATPTSITGYNRKQSMLSGSATLGAVTTETVIASGVNSFSRNGWRVDNFSTVPAIGDFMGARADFTSVDLSTDDFVAWMNNPEQFSNFNNATISYVKFIDGSGNWSKFKNHSGTDNALSTDVSNVADFYRSASLSSVSGKAWIRILDRTTTPITSSGTLDWSDIVAIEMFAQASVASTSGGGCGYVGNFGTITNHVITRGDAITPIDMDQIYERTQGISPYPYEFYRAQPLYDGQNGTTRVSIVGVTIGDGVEASHIDQANFSVYLMPNHHDVDYKNYHAFMNGNYRSIIDVNQSSGCYCDLRNGTFSARSIDEYNVNMIGHASSLKRDITNVTWWRPRTFTVTDFDLDGVVIDGFSDALVVDSSVTLTECILRNGSTGCRGLVITDAPAVLGFNVFFNDNTTHDIELGSGGAGTYELPNISVASGYTLKLHNNSATNAIVVEIPSGITHTETTAGGTISVIAAPTTTTYTNSSLADGTTILVRNITTSTTVSYTASLATGTGYSIALVKDTDYTAGDEIQVRISRKGTTTYYTERTDRIITGSGINEVTSDTVPPSCTVCDAFGLDGSDVSIDNKFDIDATDSEIDVIIGAPWQMAEAMVWWKYQMTLQSPMEDFWDVNFVESNGSFFNDIAGSGITVKFDNTTPNDAIESTGRRFYNSSGTRPIKSPKTGAGALDFSWRAPVTTVESGVSGLTAGESAKLLSLDTANLDVAVSTRASQASIDVVDSIVDAILLDTDTTIPAQITALNNLSTAQVAAELATYDAPTKAEMDAAFAEIKGPTFSSTDTLESIRDRGDSAWTTATGFSTFNPAVDVVANVTLVDTTTTNTDMRGTDGANTIPPDNASIAGILADTNELQTNQGNWVTATGFATPANVADAQTAIIAEVDANEAKIDSTLAQATLARKHLTNRDKIDTVANTLTRYDDNGTTALVVFDLKDADGVSSTTSIFEKIPQ